MEVLDSFGAWLRQRRTALGLTRAELADCVGCSVSALRKIEVDERRPSRQLAGLLAGCLRIRPDEESAFLDAARGLRLVAYLPPPAPVYPAEALPLFTGASAGTAPLSPNWNLPAPATPLIGRQAELATLARLLDDPACRLLTLVGPGGIGKTRLALEGACDVWDRFGDGVYFTSLEETLSPEFMAVAIAHAVGLNFAGTADPHRQLVSFLSHKQALLLLDNVEHLLEGIDLLAEILMWAPGVKLLVTSRERLVLKGEWVFEVQGLPVPAEGEVGGLEKNSAVQLFLQRARQACTGFEPTDELLPCVARICRLVEGMPLAIELAAAWIPVLSCREIAQEIDRGLDILTTTRRDVPERLRSMRAVFDHSWQLLGDDEQRALRQLSAFRGGFDREAAQAVAGADLALLSSLLAKSFVRRTSSGRFSMHDLVHQYVAGHLSEVPEEEMATRDRHCAYYVDFVTELEGKLKRAQQLEMLAKVDIEIDNIRRAWIWAVQHSNLTAIRLPMRAQWYFYDIRGLFQEAETSFRWLADELAGSPIARKDKQPPIVVLSAYARANQGWFCLRRGKLSESYSLLQSSLDSLRLSGMSIELADVLYFIGTVAWMTGNFQQARAYYLEELHVAEQVGDEWDVGLATGNLGLLAQTIGEYEEARQRWETTLAIFRRLGDQRTLAAGLHFSGILKCILGDYVEARARFRESLALSAAVGDRWLHGMSLSQLGEATRALGENAEAVRLLKESVVLLRELGEHWSTLQALIGLGAATAAMGDFAESRAAYYEALSTAWERQALPEVLAALSGLARWTAQQGSEDATLPAVLRSTLFVLNHPAAAQKTKEEARRLESELEIQLAPAVVETAREAAQSLSLETLVANFLAPISTQ